MLGCFAPGHRCIDNIIHAVAGPALRAECARYMTWAETFDPTRRQGGEPAGRAVFTGGSPLPAQHVIHSVGPVIEDGRKPTLRDRRLLSSCYTSVLNVAHAAGLGSVGLCSLSTGVFGYPKRQAALVTLETIGRWLAAHPDSRMRIVISLNADVDVAIVMESTYPYLKGGVSAVVHDIITGNPDLTFGIIHITWDSHSPLKDLYGMPDNVAWVKVLYLSMEEHQEDFLRARPRDLRMNRRQRRELSRRILGAMLSLAQDGQTEPLWDLISEGLSASRRYPVWAILGTREFMEAYHDMMPDLGMSMTDIFWCLRDFFSLAYAVLAEPVPRAQVYHAHTTGYAMLLGVNAAREHGTKVLLTEHNLYVRDTVNTLLERRLDLNVRLTDYRTFDVSGRERMWMAWWLEMGRLCYPYAYASTYLYPRAITEANELGGDSGRAIVIPNGIVTSEFDASYAARLAAIEEIKKEGADKHLWKLVYIARVVPIKGLLDMIDSVRLMVDRGLNIHLDVCGPTEHMPSYFEQCLTRIVEQGLESVITIRGTVKVRELLPEFDLFVLPSYNEGLPVVSLETMGAGIPTVSTDVGAVRSVVEDMIVTDDGQTWDPCGIIIEPGDPTVMADKVQEVISDVDLYERLSLNARGRVEAAYDLVKVNASYNTIYRQGGAGEQTVTRTDQGGA